MVTTVTSASVWAISFSAAASVVFDASFVMPVDRYPAEPSHKWRRMDFAAGNGDNARRF